MAQHRRDAAGRAAPPPRRYAYPPAPVGQPGVMPPPAAGMHRCRGTGQSRSGGSECADGGYPPPRAQMAAAGRIRLRRVGSARIPVATATVASSPGYPPPRCSRNCAAARIPAAGQPQYAPQPGYPPRGSAAVRAAAWIPAAGTAAVRRSPDTHRRQSLAGSSRTVRSAALRSQPRWQRPAEGRADAGTAMKPFACSRSRAAGRCGLLRRRLRRADRLGRWRVDVHAVGRRIAAGDSAGDHRRAAECGGRQGDRRLPYHDAQRTISAAGGGVGQPGRCARCGGRTA